MALQAGIHAPGKFERIDDREIDFDIQPPAFLGEERIIKLRIMRSKCSAADKLQQLRNLGFRRSGVRNHRIGNTRELDDLVGNRLLRIDELRILFHDLSVADTHCADLHDPALARIKARRLEVHNDDLVVQPALVRIAYDGGHIRQVCLDARDKLDLVLFGRAERFGECLHHAMVGDRHSRMSPLRRTLDEVRRGRDAVLLAHVGMHVQLDALALRSIAALGLFARVDIVDHHDEALFKVVHLDIAAHGKPLARLDCGDDLLDGLLFLVRRRTVFLRLRRRAAKTASARLIAEKRLALDRIGIIRHRKGKQLHFAALEFPRFCGQHFAHDDDLAGLFDQLRDLHRLSRDRAAKDGLRLFLRLLFLLSGLNMLLADHLRNGFVVFLLAPAPDLLELFLAQFDRLKNNMHLACKDIEDQLLNVRVHACLDEEFRRDILRNENGKHVALTFKRRVHHQRRAGRMVPADAAQDKIGIFHGVAKKILRQLGGFDDQRNMHRREIPPERALQRQKRTLFHEDIRRKIRRNPVACTAGRHLVQRQMTLEIRSRAFQQAFPLL